MITKHGIKEVIVLGCISAGAVAGVCLLAKNFGQGYLAIAILPIIFFGWVLWFFRDPNRATPTEAGLFISPADGTVADITPLGPDSKLGRDGVQIGIFMSVFSVHVNRMPCDSTVKKVTHQPGTFMDVRDPASYEKNESATVEIAYEHEGEVYPILVRQVAGLVARRIVTPVEPGEKIKRGQRFGMIKFGSRLEVYLPKELAGEICVELGQKAKAGLTILAKV